MINFSLPHRRYNPLTGEWILVSPQRTSRPWRGAIEQRPSKKLPPYDPQCYLCPGNKRSGGIINPKYTETFVFQNDHPAILPDSPAGETVDGLLTATSEQGVCRVICYSPTHNLTMAEMTENQITDVIQTWIRQYEEIGKLKNIKYVQIFENKGNMMGASNPHPHGQIWADSTMPTIVQREQAYQQKYFNIHNAPLLSVYAKQELGSPVRMLTQNPAFLSCVPFWATWPYETMIIPNKHIRSLSDMTVNDTRLLANTLKRLTSAYDRVFDAPFPYSMGIHQAAATGKPHDEWQMHFHFYPPLLRSATVKKFLVGYEMLAQAQRDITPEDAANTLRGYIR